MTEVADPLKTATYGVRYVLADIIQKTLPIEIRINWTFTPRLSLQAYLQPYIGTRRLPRSSRSSARRGRSISISTATSGSTIACRRRRLHGRSRRRAGPAAPFSFARSGFQPQVAARTVVLRWEYRPGSMLYFVWTQRRADTSRPGGLRVLAGPGRPLPGAGR